RPPRPTLFPYTTLFRSLCFQRRADHMRRTYELAFPRGMTQVQVLDFVRSAVGELPRPRFLQPAYTLVFEKYADSEGKRYYLHVRSEEHTSELQSPYDLV